MADSFTDGKIMNVGRREPLSSLAEEFRYNEHFAAKVRQLEDGGYGGWRRIRGDGNCCYRAAGYAFLEQLAAEATPRLDRIRWCNQLLESLRRVTYKWDVASALAHAELICRIDDIAKYHENPRREPALNESKSRDDLYRSFRDPTDSLDLALVQAIRLLVAEYIKLNSADDEAGGGISFDTICAADGYASASDWCASVVLPLGIEAEGIILNVLPKVLGIRLRIAFLDRGDCGVTYCVLGDEDPEKLVVHLQFRPGHYDVLYLHGVGYEDPETERRYFFSPIAECCLGR